MTRHNKKTQKGGDLAGNPPSAWGWGLGTAGTGWNQFMNALSLNNSQSNVLVPITNAKSGVNSKSMMGGKSRRMRRSAKRGGNVASLVSEAIVPLSLMGMNHLAGKTRRKHRKHRKYGKYGK